MAALVKFFTHRDGRPTRALTPEQDILQRWRYLASQDLRPADRQEIAALVDNEGNIEIALGFRGKDAATIINTIDKILKKNLVSNATKSHAFKLMRKLAGASRQVPKSYLVNIFHRFRVEKAIIANGGFADIRKGRFKGTDVAVKTLRTSQASDIDEIHEAFCKECVVWMNASHPNILPLFAVKIKSDAGEFSMISEMMKNGNILNYINAQRTNRIRLLEDVARGLDYLHESDIIHGDLKGANILISNGTPARACISDFGLCTFAASKTFAPTKADAGGSFGYMAPELFSTDAEPSKEVDMYAFGMVVYEVITGARPYGKRKLMEIPVLTVRGLRPSKPDDPIPAGFGQGTWEFAERCWDEDQTERPSARAALKHFERVAKTSTIVEAGLAIQIREPAGGAASRLEGSSRNLSKLFVSPANRSPRFQQTAFATRALVSQGSVVTPLLPANEEPNLLDRTRRRIGSPRPVHSRGAPPQGGT